MVFSLFATVGGAQTGDDHGNSAGSATAIGVNTSVSGAIGAAGDQDYFRVTLTAAGTLTVYTTGSTDTFGQLLDGSGQELESNDDATDTNFRISRSVNAGTYYIAVRHYSSSGTGSYVLRVEGPLVSDDHGNSVGSATAIGTNSAVQGTINSGGDQDWFRVTLTAAGTLTVYTTGSTDTFGRLLDGNGVELANNDDAADTNFRISRSVSAGTYYIAVRHYSDAGTGAYGLRADFVASTPINPGTDDHGNSVGSATAIGVNTSVSGAIGAAGDQDYFRVTLTAAGTLTVYTTGSTDTFGQLLDGSGQELESNDDATDTNFRISRSVNAGTYYIAVRHYSSSGTGSYVLRVEGPLVSDDHGTGLLATAIGTNSAVQGTINSGGDQDWFRVTLTAAGTLTVYTTGSTDTFGRLLDGNGVELANNDDAADTNFRISRTVSAGTYYIVVRHYSDAGTGAYGLRADFVATPANPGSDDHGNSVGSATAIGTNSAVQGTINSGGDQDWFRVTLTAAGTLTVYTTGLTDTFGRLLDGNGVELANNDDAADTNFRINRTVSAGTYYIVVRHYSETETGSYGLRADFVASTPINPGTDDHGNSVGSATAIGVNTSVSGAIGAAGDQDWFRVTLTAAGTLTAYTTGSTDTFGRLLDGNGVELANNDDAADTNFRISRTVSAGTYYIVVRHYSDAGTGAYGLRADFVATPANPGTDDHGNNVGSATAIGTNSAVQGTINSGGDQDWFRVTLTAAGTLTVYTTGLTDTFGRLLDGNGVELASNDDAADTNFRISRTVSAGTYYIAVRHYSDAGTGAYGLRAEFVATTSSPGTDDHGNSVGSATAIGTNSAVQGTINSGGDQDWFRVTLTAAGTLTVYTTGSTDTFGRLLDGNGVELANNDDAADTNFRISRSVSAGTYYIVVRHYSDAGTGAYGLRADFVATPANPGTDDHGNNVGSATAIGTNSAVQGTINSGGDQDWFRVTLTAAGTLTVYTTGSTDTFGRLLDGNGVELANNDDAADTNFRISRTVSAGTYYIVVRHYSDAGTGVYGLRADFVATPANPGSDDHGNSVGSATAIGTNSAVQGTINSGGDQDWFRVTLTAAGTLTVYTTGLTDTFGRLLDGNGVELASNDDAADTNFRISRTVSAGTYYIAVRHYSLTGIGRYGLRADFGVLTTNPGTDDHGNSVGSATAIGTNSAVQGTINVGGDHDYFRVTLTAAGTLTAYTTGSTDTFGRLLDGNGVELANNDDAADTNFRINRTVSAGTYYVAVSHYDPSGTGAYSLRADYVASGGVAQSSLQVELTPSIPQQVKVGSPVAISGRLLRAGSPVSNHTFYVSDGLQLMSRIVDTDAEGRFSFMSTPSSNRAAVVEFHDQSRVVKTLLFHVTNSANQSRSAFVDAVLVHNNSGRRARVTITNPYNQSEHFILLTGQTLKVADSLRNEVVRRSSFSAGHNIDFGIVGGSVMIDPRSNEITSTFTGGVLLLRGSVYYTSEDEFGVCWSPSADPGVPGVGLEGQLCVGSDGISVGGGASAGTVAAGFTFRVVEW
jgi:hypothetical protein